MTAITTSARETALLGALTRNRGELTPLVLERLLAQLKRVRANG